MFPDLSSSHFHQNMGKKTTLQIHQISLRVSSCVPNKLNTLMLSKEREFLLQTFLTLAYILVSETSAGLIVSKAKETTSHKAKELQVYTEWYFRLCNWLLGQERRNLANLSFLHTCTVAAVIELWTCSSSPLHPTGNLWTALWTCRRKSGTVLPHLQQICWGWAVFEECSCGGRKIATVLPLIYLKDKAWASQIWSHPTSKRQESHSPGTVLSKHLLGMQMFSIPPHPTPGKHTDLNLLQGWDKHHKGRVWHSLFPPTTPVTSSRREGRASWPAWRWGRRLSPPVQPGRNRPTEGYGGSRKKTSVLKAE